MLLDRTIIFAQATLRPALECPSECERSLHQAKLLKIGVIALRLTTNSGESTHHSREGTPSDFIASCPHAVVRRPDVERVDRGTDYSMWLGDDDLIEMALNEYDWIQTWLKAWSAFGSRAPRTMLRSSLPTSCYQR